MGIRKGSVVTVITANPTGDGSQNSYDQGSVLDVTDGYLVLDRNGSAVLYPWHSVRYVNVTTY